jgi:uncharacterized protein
MKKHIILLLLFTATAFAQTPKTGELTAEGNASMKVMPDVVTLTVSVSKQNESEKNALKELNEETAKLEAFFKKVGIPAKSIKIASYNINDNYTDDNDKKIYRAHNGLTIECKLDAKVLDAFYGELQAGNYKDVSVDYETGLSEGLQKKIRGELVDEAIADAKQKAEAIAKSLGVKITGISNVSKYGRDLVSVVDEVKYKALEAAPMRMDAPRPPTVFAKYEMREIEEEEQITIVFEISK